MIRKSIIWLITITLMLSVLPQQIFAAGEESLTKEVYVNVAQNKAYTESAAGNSNPSSNLLDGRFNNFCSFYGASRTVTVDLGRRYNVEKIKLTHWDGGVGNVYIANSADGSDKVSIGAMTWSQSVEAELDGTKAYRYVLIQCSTGSWKELEVYAKQTVTEVSRGKSASASAEAEGTYTADLAVNGTNSGATDSWVATSSAYHWWQVDLETPMHIGYVEIEGRSGGVDNPYADRMMFGIYGANEAVSSDVDTSNTWTVNGDKLAYMNNNSDYNPNPFPAYDPENPDAMYKTTVNDTTAYQYIIYKKEYLQAAAIGEFRAFVVNPVLNANSFDGSSISLSFSDEMDTDTINTSSIKIISANSGEEIPFDILSVDAYNYELELGGEIFGDTLTVEISEDVKNTKGVSAAKQELKYETAAAIDVEDFIFTDSTEIGGEVIATIQNAQKAGAEIKFTNNMSSQSDAASTVIIAALFDSDNTMVAASEYRKTFDPASQETICTGLDLSSYDSLEGYTLSVFVWNNFRDMKPWTDSKTLN